MGYIDIDKLGLKYGNKSWDITPLYSIWLVVYLPLWKIWARQSVGIIIPNIWKNKKMFQTTNQW